MKQRWFWVDTQTNFVLLYQQIQHVESMSKFCWHINIDDFLRHFDMLFSCNFDARIIDVILTYISDIFFLSFFKRLKIVVVLVSLIDKVSIFWIWESFCHLFSMWSHFDVLFQSNFVPPWNILCDYTVFKNSCTSRFCSDLQARAKYLRKTLLFMWSSALREKFNFYFQGFFC